MTIRLFNLDLHISVIEDIKDICKRQFGNEIEITNWSISGHNFVFNKPTPDVKGVTQENWKSFSYSHIDEFQNTYDSMLKSYDGFIVTHTPVFVMLFEKYKKPILCINTCRYDQPFCWNKDTRMYQVFEESMKRMTQSGQLLIVSNNAADYKYLIENTGIQSQIIPSLCLYTNASYNPTHNQFVVYGRYELFPNHRLLVEKPKTGYSWKDLYSYKGIIHTPYEMSTMSIFEQMWANVPLFFPTRRFYKQCIIEGKMEFISMYREWGQSITEADLDKWLDLADFYMYPIFYYYDSFEDLFKQLEIFSDPKREEREKWLELNKEEIKSKWKNILSKHFKNQIPKKIHAICLQCPGLSNSSLRPVGFSKENCFKNLIKTKDDNVSITIFFDGDIKGQYLEMYNNIFPIVHYKNGGSGAKAMRGVLEFLKQQKYDDNDIIYIIEDDFIHKPGWANILREAFSGNMEHSIVKPDYVTLYDHKDKYELDMYKGLKSQITHTESVHWRTVPSTVNTVAMLFSTLKKDWNTLYKYNCIDDVFPYDHAKYLDLGRQGRIIMSCIPGYSTHLQHGVISPCIDWHKIIQDI